MISNTNISATKTTLIPASTATPVPTPQRTPQLTLPAAAPVDRQTFQTLLAKLHAEDTALWASSMEHACARHPELRVSLLLTLTGTPLAEVAEFLSQENDPIVQALNDHADLAPGILASLERALVERRPYETLAETFARVASPGNLRDIRRSQERTQADVPCPPEAGPCETGSDWKQRVKQAFMWLWLSGSGHDPWREDRDYEAIARALAKDVTSGPTHPAWHKHGLAGTLTGLLYALNGTPRPDISNVSDLPNASDTSTVSPQASQFNDIGRAIGNCLDTVVTGVADAMNVPLWADPLAFPAAQGLPTQRTTTLAQALEHLHAEPFHPAHQLQPHRLTRRDVTPPNAAPRSPLSPSTTSQRLTDLAITQTDRHLAQQDIAQYVAPLTDWKQRVKDKLAKSGTGTGANFDPDRWFLNRFKYFTHPSDLAPGQWRRTGFVSSTSLTDAAVQLLASGEALPGTEAEYGIYSHNSPKHSPYLPVDELPSLNVTSFVDAIQTSRTRLVETLGGLAASDRRLASEVIVYSHWKEMLEEDSKLRYAAGQISHTGLILAQLVVYAPSAAARASSDSDMTDIQGYRFDVGVPGQNGTLQPGGMFAVSQTSLRTTGESGRLIVYVAGSSAPIQEFASMEGLRNDLLRGNESILYNELVQRLPLSVSQRCVNGAMCNITLAETGDDLIQMSLDVAFTVIHRETMDTGQEVVSDARGQTWTQWLAGAPSEVVESELAASRPRGYPDTLPADRQLNLRLRTMQQVRDAVELRATISGALPDLHEGASRYVAQLIKTATGVTLNPAKVFVHIYKINERASPLAHQSWKPVQSSGTVTLSQLVIDIAEGTRPSTVPPSAKVIFSLDANPVGARSFAVGSLTPEALLSLIDTGAFVAEQTRALTTFWSEHQGNVRTTLKSSFTIDAYMQYHDGLLLREGADIARQITRCPSFDTLDLDHVQDTFDPADSTVIASWLRIGVAVSEIQEFTDQTTGWILIWAPRLLDNNMKAFANRKQYNDWLEQQAQTLEGRTRLLSCFSREDRHGEHGEALKSLLALVGSDAPLAHLISRSAPMTGDPFTAYVQVFRERTSELSLHSVPRDPAEPVVLLLHALTAINWITGLGTAFRLPIPGLMEANAVLSATDMLLGGMSAALGDEAVSSAGWASLLTGITGGIPIGCYYRASTAVQRELLPFVDRTPLSRLTMLMPNLYRGETGLIVASGDKRFAIEYYPAEGTWRLTDPKGIAGPGPSISQTYGYEWVLESDLMMSDSEAGITAVFHEDISREFVDVQYRAKCATLANSADPAERAAFAAGKQEAGASFLKWDETYRPADLLKLDLISLDPKDAKLAGILARRVEDALRFEATQRALVNARIVAAQVREAGGTLEAFTQTAYINSNADGHTGFCLPLTRAMTAALHMGKEDAFIGNIRNAIEAPKSDAAIKLRNGLIALHSNVNARQLEIPLRGVRLTDNALTIEELFRLLTSESAGVNSYLIKTRAHAMSVTLSGDASWFYDANFGLAKFESRQALAEAFIKHLLDGGLGHLYQAYGSRNNMLFLVDKLQTHLMRRIELTPGVFVNDLLEPLFDRAVPPSGS
ncbi:Toxin Afp18 [Pandoraea pneumonica]|uniref:Toxin Afp18 n=1 Tax=Pandoraea pneumonica TaxID=2508299 RepID=A0A5E4TL12_9BURK|nr:Toxin Afp18 [Pandoraea pneumonica]